MHNTFFVKQKFIWNHWYVETLWRKNNIAGITAFLPYLGRVMCKFGSRYSSDPALRAVSIISCYLQYNLKKKLSVSCAEFLSCNNLCRRNYTCWALQTTFDPTPRIPQEHDSTPRRLSSVYPRQETHVLFTKNGPVQSECKLNNVNPHIIRNQYQIQNQIEVTLNEHRYCKWCHNHKNTEF